MHSRIFYLLLSLFLLIQASLVAQSNTENYNPKSDSLLIQKDSLIGSLSSVHDKRIDDLLMLDLLLSSQKQGFNGYRIQIYSESSIDSSIDEAHAFLNTFEQKFPALRVYLNYYDPDFKIRVGNFRNKVECEGIIRRIRKSYPNCYTVRTFIFFKDLISPLREGEPLKDSLLLDGKASFNRNSIEINQTLNKSNTNE